MTINENGFKDCPFCGSPDVKIETGSSSDGRVSEPYWFARCGVCKARTDETHSRHSSFNEAVRVAQATWNRRTLRTLYEPES